MFQCQSWIYRIYYRFPAVKWTAREFAGRDEDIKIKLFTVDDRNDS